MKLNNALVNKIWLKTHIEDDVEDRLEDDDVAVACSLRKLLLLLHMVFLEVDVLIVLLRHPACVCMTEVTRKHTFIKKTKNILILYSQVCVFKIENGVSVYGFTCALYVQTIKRLAPASVYELFHSHKTPMGSINFTP